MANIIGLALKVTGDASGLAKGLTPVDRALDNLAKQAERATSVFQPLADKTAVAAQAQEEFAARFERISQQLRDNVIAPAEYAAAFGQLTEEAKKYAEAIDDGLRLTQQNQTAEEARASALARLKELLSLGAIDARNFGLEAAKLSSGFDGPAAERFAEAIAPLRAEFESGAISAERFAVQSEQIAAAISSSTPAAQRQAEAILELRDRFEAGRISIEQYRDEFSRIQSGDLETRFELSVVGVRESVAASDEVRQSLALLTDKQVTAALQIAGVEQLDDLRAQFAGLDGSQIDAVLRVLGVETIEEARQKLTDLGGLQSEVTVSVANARELQSTISSIESAFGSLSEAQSQLASLPDVDLRATLELLGVESIDEARDRLEALAAIQIEPRLQAVGFESIDAAREALDLLQDRSVTASLEFLGTTSLDDARERLAALDGTTVEAFLQASGFESIDAAQGRLSELQDVNVAATLEVLGVESIDEARQRLTALSDVDVDPVLRLMGVETIDAASAALDSLRGTSVEAVVSVSGLSSLEQVQQQFASLDGQRIDAVLNVLGVESIDAAKDALGTLTDTQVQAVVSVSGLSSLEQVQQQFASLDGQRIDAVLNVLGVESIEDARQRIAELSGTSIDAQLRVLGIDGIEDARNLLASVEGKNIDVIAKTLGFDSVELLTQAIDAAESKTITFNVDGNVEEQTQRVAELVKDQEEYRKAIAEGALITEQVRTAEERRARELERIDALLARGAINEETAARKRDQITGASQAAAAAEQELARAKEQAARIIEASLTSSERAQRQYDQAVQVAQDLERRGLLTKEQFNTEIRRQADIFAKAAVAAAKYDTELDKAANSDLKFNELSGILGLLPGQIGGVASRLSSFASAGEGIQKLFAGGVTNAMTNLAGSLTGLLSPATLAAAGIVGVGAAAQQIVAGLTQLEDRVEQLGNTADKLGVSFEFIQTLEEAANRSGASIEAVSAAFGRLQKSVLGVDEESKAAQKALEDIGVTTQQLTDLRPEEQYQLIGDRLASIEEPAKRTAAAVALFGRAGADLIPFFNNIAGAAVDVERFNATLSGIDRTRIDALGSSFDAVTVSLRGFGQELLTPFIGITQSISSGLASAFASVGRSVGAVLDAISPLTSAIGLLANGFLQSTSVILNFLGTALEPAAATGRLLSGVFDNISQVVTSVSGRVNDAVIGFREFFKFQEVADQFAAAFDRIGEALSRVGVIVSRFAEVTVQAVGRVGTVVREGVSQFLEFTGLGGVISRFAEGVTAAFAGLWDGIREIVGQVGGFIERVLTFAEDWLGIVPEIEEPVVATVEVDGTGAIDELLKQSKDFQKSLDDITGSVSKAIDESAKFGEAGFDAALRYQESIERLKDQLDAGLFNEETFRREAARAAEIFRSELSAVEADIRISEETEKTLANLQERINAAAAGAQQFGQAGFDAAAQFQDKLRELGQQFEDGRINAATLAAETANVTAEYGRQIDGFKQAEQLQQSILKADRDRVNALVAQGNKTTELEENAAAIRREQLRIEEEIRRQREAGNVFAAEAAAARLAQLDQVAAKTEELQQAAEQGFADGFARSFEATNRTIDELIDKAAEFGNVGANAAQQLEAAIESAQQQARDGILTRETYEREVARQQQIFAERLAGAQRVEEFLRGQLDERQRAELDAAAAVEERKKQAAQNVKAIEDRIATEREALDQARANGDLRAARAGTVRLNQLRQAQRIEQGIADGREAASRGQVAGFTRGFSQIEQFQSLVTRQNQNVLRSFSDTFGAANASLAAAGALAAEQARRAELSRPVEGAVRTADIRTAEGAALVLGLGAAEQDPALIEARLQTRQLQGIRNAIVNAVQGYLNTPVEIL